MKITAEERLMYNVMKAIYESGSADYLLAGRDYENIHAKKRLEAVLGELTEILRDFNLNSLQIKLIRLK